LSQELHHLGILDGVIQRKAALRRRGGRTDWQTKKAESTNLKQKSRKKEKKKENRERRILICVVRFCAVCCHPLWTPPITASHLRSSWIQHKQ
jgi:hypothetical protein